MSIKNHYLALFLFLSSLVLFQCTSGLNDMIQNQSQLTAEQRLKTHIDTIALLKDSIIARLPELDIAGYYAFSVMPKATGRAGEITYMVNDQEILTSGQPDHFDKIMKLVMEDEMSWPLDVKTFAKLFLRMKAIRSGVLLDKPDGHILLKPNQLPPEIFEPPSVRETPEGVNYRFWLFDTDRYLPIFWDIFVKEDGAATTFTSE
jgi:hypothetical protein